MKTTWKLGSLISLLCLSGALLAPAVAQDTPSTFEVKVQQNTPFRVTVRPTTTPRTRSRVTRWCPSRAA
jgi:hypothetical protein